MTNAVTRSLRRHHLVADDEEFHQIHPAKARGQRDVGCVAAGRHQDAADPRVIVAGGERGPPPPQKKPKTAGKKQTGGEWRAAEKAPLTRAKRRREGHASAEKEGPMRA